jgi:membrane fusion protein (multidrug efflux system)
MSSPKRIELVKHIFTAGVLLGAAALLASCGGGGEAESASADTTGVRRPVPVAVHVLAQGRAEAVVRAWGTVKPSREARITAEIPGRVASVGASLGEWVGAGRVLLEIDPALYDARVRESEASAEAAHIARDKAKRDLDRARALYDEGTISDSEMEGARTTHARAEATSAAADAALEQARKNLAAARLRAPFAGEVASRLPDVGTTVALGAPLTTLVDIARVRVEAAVSEEDLARVKPGNSAVLTVEAVPGGTFNGTVTAVGPQADPESGQFPVEIEVVNPEGHPLKGGMVARCEVVYRTYEAVPLLPVDALVESKNGDVCYVVRNGEATARTLVLGPRQEQLVAVIEGAAAGDSVVVLGQGRLAEGVPVRVEEVR